MKMAQFGTLLWTLLMAGSASTRAAISDQESQDKTVAAVAAINGTVQAPGLRTGVRVQRDRWGVAHIYAKNHMPIATATSASIRPAWRHCVKIGPALYPFPSAPD